MYKRKYEILLGMVIAARATSFIFTKMMLEDLDTFNLLAIRFVLAFLLLFAVFSKRIRKITKHDFLSGILVGTLFFCVMVCELTALKTTASSTVSLLENCSIILVPLFESVLLKRFPDKITLICAFTAFLGVFFLNIMQGSFSGGFMFGLLSAVLYAIAIIVTAKVSTHSTDSLCIGIVQVGTTGILSLIFTFIFESPILPADGWEWIMIVLLAVICTCFGFTLQPVAQSHVSVERAGLFCAISPAIATLLGTLVLHESFGIFNIIGLTLILFSIILPYIIR